MVEEVMLTVVHALVCLSVDFRPHLGTCVAASCQMCRSGPRCWYLAQAAAAVGAGEGPCPGQQGTRHCWRH